MSIEGMKKDIANKKVLLRSRWGITKDGNGDIQLNCRLCKEPPVQSANFDTGRTSQKFICYRQALICTSCYEKVKGHEASERRAFLQHVTGGRFYPPKSVQAKMQELSSAPPQQA